MFLPALFASLLVSGYTESDSKIGRWQGEALTLSQAKPSTKQLNLNKLSDAVGLKGSGSSTQPEPIFESRAVYTEFFRLFRYRCFKNFYISPFNETQNLIHSLTHLTVL